MRKYSPIYEEAVSHIWLCNCSILNFLIYEENVVFLFYQCTVKKLRRRMNEDISSSAGGVNEWSLIYIDREIVDDNLWPEAGTDSLYIFTGLHPYLQSADPYSYTPLTTTVFYNTPLFLPFPYLSFHSFNPSILDLPPPPSLPIYLSVQSPNL